MKLAVSPLFLLFLVFLTLKLAGYIAWSWWWVTAPLWGGLAAVAAIFIAIFVFLGTMTIAERLTRG